MLVVCCGHNCFAKSSSYFAWRKKLVSYSIYILEITHPINTVLLLAICMTIIIYSIVNAIIEEPEGQNTVTGSVDKVNVVTENASEETDIKLQSKDVVEDAVECEDTEL